MRGITFHGSGENDQIRARHRGDGVAFIRVNGPAFHRQFQIIRASPHAHHAISQAPAPQDHPEGPPDQSDPDNRHLFEMHGHDGKDVSRQIQIEGEV